MENTYKTVEFESFGKSLVASDNGRGKVCIGLREPADQTPNQIGDLFLATTDFAKNRKLTLIGSEARSLAFLFNTQGRGNLWFFGELGE